MASLACPECKYTFDDPRGSPTPEHANPVDSKPCDGIGKEGVCATCRGQEGFEDRFSHMTGHYTSGVKCDSCYGDDGPLE